MPANPKGTRSNVDAPALIVKGATVVTGAASLNVEVPVTGYLGNFNYKGDTPNRVRLAATAACYAKLTNQGQEVVAPGSGYVTGDTLVVVGGTSSVTRTGLVETAQLLTAAINAVGSGYLVGDTITLAGGVNETPAVVEVDTTQLASAAVNAPGTGYVISEAVTTAGGTSSTAAVVTATHIKAVSATVNAGGTGDLGDGSEVIVEGTTGTGTKFQAAVTIVSNAIDSVQRISLAGDYTADMTSIAAEPVTYVSGAVSGTTLTGATLAVVMGLLTVSVTTPGDYTVESSALTQASTSGSGTGATFDTALYGVLTNSVTVAGDYSTSIATFTQASTDGDGTGATFDTGVYGVLTMSEVASGVYSANPSNPVSTTSGGSGTGATFTLTWADDAAAGDIMITPECPLIVDAVDFDHVSAIQVSGAGVLHIGPLEN
ncbi:MAG: hypothetical protein KAR40_07945 [Candidatus Sabulitectum sp.]|nr:hypothetical protein [Candidatus Sabulitectum sp.]